MKKFIFLLLCAFAIAVNAQNKVVTLTPTSAGGVATYSLASLVGTAPMLIMAYDSAVAAYVDPTTISTLVTSQTFTNAQDQAWFDALLYFQKYGSAGTGSPLGLIPLKQYYNIQATGTLLTKSRYTSIQVFTR